MLAAALLVAASLALPGSVRAQAVEAGRAEASALTPLEQRRLEALMAGIVEEGRTPLGYPQLLLVDDLQDLVPAEVLESRLTALAEARRQLDPLLAAQVDWRLAALDTRRGRLDAAAARLDALGMLTRWQVLGPFDNEGLFAVQPPEDGIDPEASVDGRYEGLSWRALVSRGRIGYVRLASVVAPTVDTTSYVATVVDAPRALDAVLWLGADGAYRVWHDGVLVGEQRNDLGGHLDRDGWTVRLKPGPNLLVVKLTNAPGDAGFYARLTDAAHEPLMLEHGHAAPRFEGPFARDFAVPPQPKKGTPATPEQVRAALHVASLFDRLDAMVSALGQTETPPEVRATVLAWAALARDRLGSVEGSSARHAAQGLARQALELAPHDPVVVELAARTLEEPWRRRAALDQALAARPDDRLLQAMRVEELLRGSVFDRADDLEETLEQLRAAEPESVMIGLLMSEWLGSQGLIESAHSEASALVERWPTTAAALDELSWRAYGVGRYAECKPVLEALLSVRADVDAYREELATLMAQRGELDAALAVVEAGLAARPDAESLAQRRIELLDAAGRESEAREAFAALLAAKPTSASLHAAWGDWLLAHGDHGAALEAWRASLALEATDEGLRQMVRYLDPSVEGFERPWLVTDLSEVAPVLNDGRADFGVALDQRIVLLHPNGLSSVYTQTVYEVLSEEGATQLRYLPLYYTPGEEVLEVDTVRVVKPDGVTREVFERHEYSVADEAIRMYYDYRQAILEVSDLAVGDRVEVRWRKSQTSAVNYFDNQFGDVWFVQDTVPRGRMRYVLIAPASRAINVRLPENGEVQYTTEASADGRQVVHVLERNDTLPVAREHMMPGFAEVADYVVLSTFGGWGEVAKWYWELARDQWVVDAEIRDVVRRLTDGVTDRREIVSRIHNYVVKNTRYVALEFGVHGYKPYRTTVCFKRRFGDCKDKASLIKVMLEEAGVPTDIVLVRTRRNGAIATDPATLRIFDHAIAYVPEFDLFLDGTAEFSGTAELPSMDQGVTVLIVKDGGGWELRQTPVLPSSASRIENHYTVALSTDGATLAGRGSATGEFAPGYRQRYESHEKRRDLFEDELAGEYPGAVVESLQFESIDDLESPVAFNFSARLGPLVRPAGDVLSLLPLGHSADLGQRLAPSVSRTQALVLPFAFEFHNVFDFTPPPGYRLERAPAPVTLETPQGTFTMTVVPLDDGGDGFRVETRFALHEVQVAPLDYPGFRDFVSTVDRTLNTPLRLVPGGASASR